MKPRDIEDGLERIAASEHFVHDAYRLVDEWKAASVGVEAIEHVLHFMERHPDVDLGTPGPLVQFLEQFRRKGYEERLFASLSRKPTAHTLWMLNRIINDTQAPAERAPLMAMLERAAAHPEADAAARDAALEFREYQTR